MAKAVMGEMECVQRMAAIWRDGKYEMSWLTEKILLFDTPGEAESHEKGESHLVVLVEVTIRKAEMF